jgi:uncharacterized protein
VGRYARRAWQAARLFAALALFALAGISSAVTWDGQREGVQPVPPLRARVTDLTGTLSAAEQQALDAKLAAWEQQTTNQLAVLIVPTTKPETIEEYSIRVAEAWKLGQKGKDNGVLLLVAKNDKQMRIEVGYGLEGDLPDVTARRIIGDTIAPYFGKGQFAAGIGAGVDRIIAVVSGTEPPPEAQPQRRAHSGGVGFGDLAIFLLIGVTVIGGILRAILGKVGGGLAGAAITTGVVWLVIGSLLLAALAGVIAFVLISLLGTGGRGGPGIWPPIGGGGWSGGGVGGGGFSGGGGSFGGGGASGGW